MLEQIDPLIVSMDRIGSTHFHNDQEEALVVNRFSLEFDLALRLSAVRKVLSKALDAQVDRETLIEIEERLERLPCWERQ